MDFKQVVESERLMVLTAPERYGMYYTHAFEASAFLSNFIKSLDGDRLVFGRFYSLIKNHHLLALLSTVRLHEAQSTMNLRHVLEAGACAAFAIAKPDSSHFVTTDSQGLLNSSKKLTGKIYSWLDENYPDGSKNIKAMKDIINASTAHANLVFTGSNFRENEGSISSPFFDYEDIYFVKTDLWRIGKIAISLLDLFYGVNQGLNVINFVDDFHVRLDALVMQSKAIHAEMTSTDRYKAAAMKAQAAADRACR
jgi:hypothetical protein